MSNNPATYDVTVIGSGPGGYIAAIRSSQLGMKVAIVEKNPNMGGTCLNVGCIPSKALLESSEVYHKVSHGLDIHGIGVKDIEFNLDKIMDRKNKIVDKLRTGVAGLMKKNKVDVFKGLGSFIDKNTIQIESEGKTETITTKNVIIATGSVPIELPFLKFDAEKVVSSDHAIAFDEVPENLTVIGAGVIGLELGSVWNRLGSKVRVVEATGKILGNLDNETSKKAQKVFESQGMEFHLDCKVKGTKEENGKFYAVVESSEGEKLIESDKVLVSIGRKPFTDGLNLENAGVELDERRRIKVNEFFKSSSEGIYAIGDVISGPMLAHKAEEEGVTVSEIIAGKNSSINYRSNPFVVYTWPEIAWVGYGEQELKAAGIPYKKGNFPFMANGRALCMDEEDGFVKVLAHKETGKLLGVFILGARASDLIAEVAVAFHFDSTASELAHAFHAHPTMAEAVKEAALAVDKLTLNL